MAKRRCNGTNAAGNPCDSPPLRKGTVIDDVKVSGDWCRAHDPELPDSARPGGAQPGAGRPRLPRPSEIMQRLAEENVLALQRPYWRTLGYDVLIGPDGPYLVELAEGGAKMSATFEGRVKVSQHDDLGAQMAAAEKLQDRVYGKPKQATEISGPDGGAVNVRNVDIADPDVRKWALDMIKSAAPIGDD